jgi:lipopolysaccharide export LptBFGC system permease protein LptF
MNDHWLKFVRDVVAPATAIYPRHLLVRFVTNLFRVLAVLLPVFLVVGCSPQPSESLQGLVAVLASAVNNALPLALLVATLFTVGELARYRELTALAAAGWSMLRIARPIIGVAMAATLLSGTLQVSGLCRAPGAVAATPFVQRHQVVAETVAARTEAHARHAYPLLNLFAVLTAIPLAGSRRRVTVFAGFNTALAIMAAYHIVTATVLAFGRYGAIPPLMAGWLGPAIFTVGIVLLWRRTKQ